MATNAEVGKSFLAGVIASLPEGVRAQAQAAFDDAQAQAALEAVGAGVKRQEDYSRSMDEARAEKQRALDTYNQNKVWYDANAQELQNAALYRQRLAELDAAPKPTGTPDPAPAPTPKPPDPSAPKLVTADEFDRTQDIALELFGYVIPKLVRKHERLFNEDLDTKTLIAEARAKGIMLEDMYNAKYATQLKTKAEEAEAARVKKIEDDAVARFQREHPQMPYPSPAGNDGSPLDGLKAGPPVDPGVNRNLVDESVQFYNELLAKST